MTTGKQYTQKQAAAYAASLFQANQLNQNTPNSPFFVGHLSSDRKTVTDPQGTLYNLSFTGNPKEYDLCRKLSPTQALCIATANSCITIDGEVSPSLAIYESGFTTRTIHYEAGDVTYQFPHFSLWDFRQGIGASLFDTSNFDLLLPPEGITTAAVARYPYFAKFDSTGKNVIVAMASLIPGEDQILDSILCTEITSVPPGPCEVGTVPNGQVLANPWDLSLSYKVFIGVGISKGVQNEPNVLKTTKTRRQDNLPILSVGATDGGGSPISAVYEPPFFCGLGFACRQLSINTSFINLQLSGNSFINPVTSADTTLGIDFSISPKGDINIMLPVYAGTRQDNSIWDVTFLFENCESEFILPCNEYISGTFVADIPGQFLNYLFHISDDFSVSLINSSISSFNSDNSTSSYTTGYPTFITLFPAVGGSVFFSYFSPDGEDYTLLNRLSPAVVSNSSYKHPSTVSLPQDWTAPPFAPPYRLWGETQPIAFTNPGSESMSLVLASQLDYSSLSAIMPPFTSFEIIQPIKIVNNAMSIILVQGSLTYVALFKRDSDTNLWKYSSSYDLSKIPAIISGVGLSIFDLYVSNLPPTSE